MFKEKEKEVLNLMDEVGYPTIWGDLQSLETVGHYLLGVPQWAKAVGELFQVPAGSVTVTNYAYRYVARKAIADILKR